MSGDVAVYLWIVTSFAALVTAHATLALGLASRSPRWRAAVALVVPPLAPYFGLRDGLTVRAACWVASLVSYAAALLVGYRAG